MPIIVTMHASSMCPVMVDFDVFRCYLAGYSVDEAVDHIRQTRLGGAQGRGAAAAEKTEPLQQREHTGPSPSSASTTLAPGAGGGVFSPNSSAVFIPSSTSVQTAKPPPGGSFSSAEASRRQRRLQSEDRRHSGAALDAAGEETMDGQEEPLEELLPDTAEGAEGPSSPAAPVLSSTFATAHGPSITGGGNDASSTTSSPTGGGGSTMLSLTTTPLPPPLRKHGQESAGKRKDKGSSMEARHGQGDDDDNDHHDRDHLHHRRRRSRLGSDPVSSSTDRAPALPTERGEAKSKKHSKRRHGKYGTLPLHQSTRGGVSGSSALPRHPSADNADIEDGSRTPENFFQSEAYLAFERRLQHGEPYGGSANNDSPSSGGGPPLARNLLFLETTEQYRLYELLIHEEFLTAPYAFLSKHYLPVAVPDRLQLVSLFYEADAPVFRYFFGDRMQKFEPIAANAGTSGGSGLAGLRAASSTSPSSFAAATPLSSSPAAAAAASASASAAAGVGHRLFQWAMRGGDQNDEAISRLLGMNATSLRRQWENIKRVCGATVSMYLGRSDTQVPRGVSVLEAVQQCYGIRGELATSYATAVFGYHHRLSTRLLDQLSDFADYSTLCNVIAAQWCDQSLLLLDEAFVDRCRRIGRQLEESRLLAEMHVALFGEALRPRWQVQLDEVQRAIVPANAPGAGATPASTTAPLPTTVCDECHHPSSAVTPGRLQQQQQPGSSPLSAPPFLRPPQAPSPAPAALASPSALLSHSPPSLYVDDGAAPAGSPTSTGTGGGGGGGGGSSHSLLCANKKFSRRFMLEFPYIMRNFARIAAQLGAHASINDALEIFHSRIFANLEAIGTRSAPALASAVLSSAAAVAALSGQGRMSPSPHQQDITVGGGGGGGGGSRSHASLPKAFSTGDAGTVGGIGGGRATRRPSVTPLGDDTHNTHMYTHHHRHINTPTSPLVGLQPGGDGLLMRAHSAPTFAADDPLTASPNNTTVSAVDSPPPPFHSHNGHTHLHSAAAAAVALAANPMTSVVNTSMAHPVGALLAAAVAAVAPSPPPQGFGPTAAAAAMMDANGVLPSTPAQAASWGNDGHHNSNNHYTSPPHPSMESLDATAYQHLHPSLHSAATAPPGLGYAMVKVLDKRCLRELSMLLSALPRVWSQLQSLSAQEHLDCDNAFADFIIAWKVITQVLMAADDFQ